MARRLEYTISTDPSEGIKGLKQFSTAVKRAMKDIDSSTDEAATSGQKLAKVLSDLAGDMDKELKSAATAAEALGKALGPELAGRADIPSIIADLNRMGLTFDEITADADQLGASLKQLDTVQTGGAATKIRNLEDAARRSGGGIDELDRKTKSADSSASVLANTIGNTTQDLGALGGIAGTAGVAMGQMGEYMADAISSGEGLKSVLTSFGPIAVAAGAITLAFQALSDIQSRFADSAARTAELFDTISDAVAEGDEGLDAYGEKLKELKQVTLDNVASQSKLTNLVAEAESHWYSTGLGVKVFAELLGAAEDETEDMIPLLNQAGIAVEDWLKVVSGSAGSTEEFAAALTDTSLSAEDQQKILTALSQAQVIYNDAAENGGVMAEFFGKALEEVADGVDAFMKANKPVSDMAKSWEVARQAVVRMKAGLEPTNRQLAVARNLARQYGTDMAGVWDMAGQQIDDYADAVEHVEDATQEWADALRAAADEAIVVVADAELALDDMASNFSEMARRETAISDIFDLGNAPIDALTATKDVEDAIRDLGDFIREEGVPDLLDPNDVDAGPYLAKWESLRGPIQAKIAEAFTIGDPQQAIVAAEAYVKQVTQSMRNALGEDAPTEDEVRTLLGLDNLQARIEIAVDQESLAQAQAMLEVLTGLPGADPVWKAQVLLDLQAGTLSPEAAQVMIADKLGTLGVDVPMELLPPAGSELDQARRDAETWTTAHPVRMPSEVNKPSNMAGVYREAQTFLNGHPLIIPIRAAPGARGVVLPYDAGGTTGRWGGIVAEKRPEIINSRYLATTPTVVPPGTRVTSGARTARILRTRGTAGLRRYDQGGTVTGPRTVNINLNASVIGNRFDVNRQIRKAAYENARLLGVRP